MINIQDSEKESGRFNRLVLRAFADEINKDVIEPILERKPDLVILRTPTSQIPAIHMLSRTGINPLIADTLVYYYCDLKKLKISPLKNADIKFVKVDKGNRQTLIDLVGTIFHDYCNHYSSNPFLDAKDIWDAFVDWGQSFDGSDPTKMSWIAMKGDKPVAFCNCAVVKDEFEGVLYGVHPDFAGHGIYGDLVSFTQQHALDQGFERMFVSTQIQNLTVQKAWVKRGFYLERSVYTVHLNLFLSEKWNYGTHKETIQWTAKDVSAIGQVTGDTNPLHFDDEVAKKAGFRSAIAHGVLINGAISRILGTKCPGIGTIYLSQTSQFQAPIYPGEKYQLELAIKHVDAKRNFATVSTNVRTPLGARVFTGQAMVKVGNVQRLLASATGGR